MNQEKTDKNPYADALYDIAFWIEHNCKKARNGHFYLVKRETIEQMNQGKMPTLL